MVRQDIDIDGKWLVIVCYDVQLGEVNSGFTHTDFSKRRSIVGIGKSTSRSQFLNTVVHEAKHVQSHICRYYGVDEDSKDAAYLIGYIAMKMTHFIREFLR